MRREAAVAALVWLVVLLALVHLVLLLHQPLF
jgi:hypothetical protein